MKLFVVLIISTLAWFSSGQFDPHWWNNRSGIVHLFSWKFADIANECEHFLAPHRYAGVQVSPIQEYVVVKGRPWWERYQPVSYKIFSRSGDEAAFLDMTKRCNAVGIRIYVDIIINHMAAADNGWRTGIGGSKANPTTLEFPAVPYSFEDFNQPQCAIDPCWCNAVSIRNCNLEGLTDLNVTRQNVRDRIIEFMNHVIDLGAAGFRVDTAKHMWPFDLKNIFPKVKDLNPAFGFEPSSRPFIAQEVIDLGGGVISKFEYHHLGTVTEFKFQDEIGRAFRGANELKYLRSFGETWQHFSPSNKALTFVDNHDSQRSTDDENVLTYKHSRNYKMATAFHLAWNYGIPRLMSSFDFVQRDVGPPMDEFENIVSPIFFPDNTCGNGWICEHRWRQMYNMIAFRNEVKGTPVENWWDNWGNQIAFSRGNQGFIAFNGQYGVDMKVWLQTGLPEGIYCDVISGSYVENTCTGYNVTVYADGKAEIILPKDAEDGVFAFHRGAKLRM